jgi:hypothetical protein
MKSIQDKFFALLDERAEAEGLEVVQAAVYANTGVIHLQKAGSFETAVSIPYDFQRDRVYFGSMGRPGPAFFPRRPNPHYAGWTPTELDDAIDAILEAATARQVR